MQSIRAFAQNIGAVAASVVGTHQQPSSNGIIESPEYLGNLQQVKIVEQHCKQLLDVCSTSQHNNASMFLGSDFFAEELSSFVSDMQKCKDCDVFISSLAQISSIQKEIRAQRKELDESVTELLVVPLRAYLKDLRKLQDALKALAEATKAYHSAVAKIDVLEKLTVPDPQKLLQVEVELVQTRLARETAEMNSVIVAKETAMKKDMCLLSDFRLVIMRQLQHFRYCLQVIESAAPLIASLDDHCKEVAHQFEVDRTHKAQVDAKNIEQERTNHYSPLINLLSDPSSLDPLITAASTAQDIQSEVVEQLLTSIARALDSTPNQSALRIIRSAITTTVDSDSGSSSKGSGSIEGNALFVLRGNSATTRFLGVYSRLHTSKWLPAVLHEAIQAVLQNPEACEIDPSKTKGGEIDITAHSKILSQHCDSIFSAIRSGIKTCPPQLRNICKHLRATISAKRGEAAGDLACGGLFFLRLVCPSIMHATSNIGDQSHPISMTSGLRALVLIAKVIQSIASEATELKEPFMKPMQTYVNETRPSLHSLYDELCNVTDAEVATAPPLADFENVSLSDLPLITDIIRSNFAVFVRQLNTTEHHPLLIKLCRVIASI